MKSLNGTKDVPTFQKFIRFNKGPKDPNPHDVRAGFGISARFDLVPRNDENYGLGGGIDGKMSTVSLARNLQFYAQNGPTHDDVTPFDWSQVSPPSSAPKHAGTRKVGFPVLF